MRAARWVAGLGAVALLLCVAGGGGVAAAGAAGSADVEVVVGLRVWQDVERPENIWVSARPAGGDWRTLGTVPFPLTRLGEHEQFRYRDLAVGGVRLRIAQYLHQPGSVWVRPCGTSCRKYNACQSLGVSLSLDDGRSRSGKYRYGNLTLPVPLRNQQLEADGEYLLALRDTLAATATLNWDADRDMATWTGVVLEGVPQRVTGLQLANNRLMGELSGLLGNLTGLRQLRLEGNSLTGRIPSKLGQLPALTHLYLGGNSLTGCIPSQLRAIMNTDMDSLGLPVCEPPIDISSFHGRLTEGTYLYRAEEGDPPLIFDVPAGLSLEATRLVLSDGEVGIILEDATGPWVGVNLRPCGQWRRAPADMSRAPGTIGDRFDRLLESRWLGEGE